MITNIGEDFVERLRANGDSDPQGKDTIFELLIRK